MMKHKVVLVPFPFDDLSSSKVRSAVSLTDPIGSHGHVALAFITSKIPDDLLSSDLVLLSGSPEFKETGLKVTSTLRLHRLLTVSFGCLQRELGQLAEPTQRAVQNRLRQLFLL